MTQTMTRQIKFRAWDGKTMRFGDKDYTPFSDSENSFPDDIIKVTSDHYGWKWMQFTGLLDKNGKEIYEGDILKENGIVEYREGCGGGIEEVARWIGFEIDELTPFQEDEIIGNIYENPELLKNDYDPIKD